MNGVTGLLESLVVSLREGIEIALVVGVLLVYLNRTGRRAYSRFVLLGLVVAVLASLAGAALVLRYGLDPENPILEGCLMFVAAALVSSLLVWMWRTGRSMRHRLEQRLETLVGQSGETTIEVRAASGIFAFAFLMVLREGLETVLFLTALSGTTGGQPFSTALGASLGLGLAVLFGVLLVQGSLHINLRRFFTITGVVLVVLVLKLVAGGLHEFFEAGFIASTPLWEDMIEVFTSKTASIIILALLVVAPLGSMVWDWWRAPGPHIPEQPNGAHP
jgi:high-affinity iron transporter